MTNTETAEGKTIYIENTDPNQPLSRYNKIRLCLNDQGIPVQEAWEMEELPELPTDRFYEVTQEFAHRLDLISLKYYGTAQLYWVIAFANKMIDPIAETVVGVKLRIPDREYVFQTVLAK